jgi:tetratricopeptide (TPR) repeat protein
MNIEAEVYQLKTEYTKARCIHEAILRQTSAELSPIAHAHALASIAFLDTVTGASAEIVSRNLDTATVAFQNAHFPRGISTCELFYADLLLREGDAAGARAKYLSLFSSLRSSDDELACFCLAKLADPIKPMHASVEIVRWAVVFLAFTLRTSVRNLVTVNQALRCLGDVLMRQGADDTALSILMVALEGFTRMDVHQSRAECMLSLGDISMKQGEFTKALQFWEAARPLFERTSQARQIALFDERIATVSQKISGANQEKLAHLSGLHPSTGIVEASVAHAEHEPQGNNKEKSLLSHEASDKIPLAM